MLDSYCPLVKPCTHTHTLLPPSDCVLKSTEPPDPTGGSLGMSLHWFCPGSFGISWDIFFQLSEISQVHLDEMKPSRKRKSVGIETKDQYLK